MSSTTLGGWLPWSHGGHGQFHGRVVGACHTCDSSPSAHLHRTHIGANYIIWVRLDVNLWWTTSRMEQFPLVETI